MQANASEWSRLRYLVRDIINDGLYIYKGCVMLRCLMVDIQLDRECCWDVVSGLSVW